jgi:uncharacterized membrane protein
MWRVRFLSFSLLVVLLKLASGTFSPPLLAKFTRVDLVGEDAFVTPLSFSLLISI